MRRLLVPLDGSQRGDQILTFVDRMVPELRARELVLLRVLTESSGKEVAQERLAATARRLADAGLKPVSLMVVGDDPAAEVVKVAELTRPWLVTLSTHGEGESDAPRGSVAARVIEACPAPLLLVGRQALPLDPGPGLARILVALDGSRAVASILPFVVDLARPSNAEVLLTHVKRSADEASADLDAARERLRQEDVERVRVIQATGDVAPALLDVARREAVDLLALGARGGTVGGGLGSVARAVALRSDCPLLIVR